MSKYIQVTIYFESAKALDKVIKQYGGSGIDIALEFPDDDNIQEWEDAQMAVNDFISENVLSDSWGNCQLTILSDDSVEGEFDIEDPLAAIFRDANNLVKLREVNSIALVVDGKTHYFPE